MLLHQVIGRPLLHNNALNRSNLLVALMPLQLLLLDADVCLDLELSLWDLYVGVLVHRRFICRHVHLVISRVIAQAFLEPFVVCRTPIATVCKDWLEHLH